MVTNSTTAKPDFAMNDLGPLAWVLDELRKSLNSASKALKRFAWDAEAARGSDLAAIDASQLRIARQQLHQAVGALEMVGLTGPVLMLRAMEAAVQKFVLQPEHCSQEAVAKIEYASFALTEYLEGVLADRPVSPVSLFPQYRDVQELVRADRIHPADLWPLEWRWAEPKLAVTAEPRQYGSEARAIMDQSVLQLMKGKAPQAAGSLGSLSLGFAAQQTERRLKIFWIIAAGYFEAVAHDLLGADLYIRRVASRVLLQYASLAKGDTTVSERLAHDMVFFCAQAAASPAGATPVLAAVRAAYGLSRFKPVNYELVQFGRFDPALLAQARKRIVSAKEGWSSLCAGDTSKAKTVAEQFALVTESLLKLHPPSEPLAQALSRAIQTTVSSAQAPGIELAMEVATSMLYLEAVFEDLDPNDPQLAVRTASLAQRLESVRAGGNPQPLESWMEELYSRVSDKQTMGSVVGELRVSLGELEKSLDAFFRNPKDKTTLQTVPGQLSQMRGVLSVLGLDQACKAVFRMKTSVQKMLDTETDPELARAAGTFEYLGNNVGALSFLIDMLNYQPVLAKKLFVYNEENGELKPLMGRAPSALEAAEVAVAVDDSDALPVEVALVAAPGQVLDMAPPAQEQERSNPDLLVALADGAAAAPVIPVVVAPAAAVLVPLDPLPPPLEMLVAAPSVLVKPPAPVQDEGAFDLDLTMQFTDAPVAPPAQVKLPAPVQDDGAFDLDLAMEFTDEPVAVPVVAAAPVVSLDTVSPDPLPLEMLAAAPPAQVKLPAPVQDDDAFDLDLAMEFPDATAAPLGNQPEAPASALTAMTPPPMQMPVVPAAPPLPVPVVQSSASVDYEEDDDFDLQEIFLEEAREVVGNATQAIDELAQDPADTEQLTVLRRAFHTLKGSARMVELNEFGEAGWALEQMLNSWLADQKPATKEFRTLCAEVIAGFESWIAAIAQKQDASWSATAFRESAEAMRLEGRYIALNLSGQAEGASTAPPAIEVAMPVVPQAPQVPEQPPVPEQPTAQESPPFVPEPEPELVPEPEAPVLTDSGVLDEAQPVPSLDFFDILPEAEPIQVLEIVEPVPEAQAVQPVKVAEAPAQASTDAFVTELADIDFDSFFTLSPQDEALPAVAAPLGAELAQSSPPEPVSVEAIELSAADFAEQFPIGAQAYELSPPAEIKLPVTTQPEPALSEPMPLASAEPVMPEFSLPRQDVFVPVTAVQVGHEVPASDRPDENVMVIDGLRIGTALYNVYLAEADQWSSHLVSEVAEWSHENHQLVSASTVALAHSLAGSSATVGFHALSEVARALEHALENSRDHRSYDASAYSALFVEAAQDIRRLLHQFAAGFLKQPQADILARLRSLEFPDVATSSMDEYEAYGTADESEFAIEDDFEFLFTPLSEVPAAAEVEFVHAPEAVVQAVLPAEIAPVAEMAVLTKAEFAVVHAERQVPASVNAEVLSLSAENADMTLPAPVAPAPAPVAAKAFNDHPGIDDDIDAVDAIDPDLFPIFEEECEDLMPRLSGALRHWAEQPGHQGARLEVLRVLHTLKGSARLSGALRLGEMAHRIESEIEHVGSDAAQSQEFEPLLTRLDGMQAAFDALRHRDEAAAGVEQAPAPVLQTVQQSWTPSESEVLESLGAPEESGALAVASVVNKFIIPGPQAMVMQAVRQAATASIRVRSQLLDRMVNQAGEVMITRSRLEAEIGQLRDSLNDMSGNLTRLRQQLRDIELQAETQMQSRLALAKEAQAGFDPLEFDRFTRVQELTRMMAESVNDVATVQRTLQRTIEATEDDLIAQGRQTRELQRDLLRTRMVEFESISERLYRVVRQTAKEIGKQVRLDLLGGNLEMDRGMLERMVPAFEHLLRNCVSHGIELPQVRTAAGKDPVGLISIHLRQDGNDVSVDFSDDGAGLNLKRIREIAIQRRLITADQVLDDTAAGNLIFLPGFSTATQVTEVAGRGIGMEVVRTEVNALGGRIETSTVVGQGSHFKLVLPLTTAVTQVVMIRADKLSVGVPANVVETVRRISIKELQQAYNTGTLDVAGEMVPFFWAGALLQASHHSSEVQTKTTPVVIFRSAAQRLALHVDEVLGNREVVVKNLGPQLSRLPGMAGMSVLPSGAVVLIYNPVALAAVYGQQARSWSADQAEPHMLEGAGGSAARAPVKIQVARKIPLILVVDDSITVRRVTQRMLLRDGYRVALAADGLQALERLQDELPAVVLSDIEMPRMDGFDLARNIRGDERLKKLPIIMITSRIAEKHHEHAKELGVDHYLGKPYSEDELMKLVRHYCALEAAAAVGAVAA